MFLLNKTDKEMIKIFKKRNIYIYYQRLLIIKFFDFCKSKLMFESRFFLLFKWEDT